MGGCSAPGCSNRSGLGMRLFGFPAERERRRKWIVNCGRDNWTPTAGSRLCEKHFNDRQFEANRLDGWRKLRPDAVPTVFDFLNPSQMCRSPRRRRSLKRQPASAVEAKALSKDSTRDHSYTTYDDAALTNSAVLQSDLSVELPSDISVSSSSSQYSMGINATLFCLESSRQSPKKHERLKVQVETLKAREKMYLSEIRSLNNQLKILDKILSNTEKNLEKILSPDQIHDVMFGSYDE